MRAARNPPRLVLFDLDDTIFDHSMTCRAALREVCTFEPRLAVRPLDVVWTSYLHHLHITDQTLGYAGRPARAYFSARAGRFRALAAESGWSCTPSEAEVLSARYREHYQRLRRPIPGAVDTVRRLARDHIVGIVTNNQVAEQEEKLRFLGLRETIDPLVISEAVGVEKPDPAIFRRALADARVPAREAVMVGDSWANDVLGARSAGIRPVWFNRFGAARPTRHRVPEFRSYRPYRQMVGVLDGFGTLPVDEPS